MLPPLPGLFTTVTLEGTSLLPMMIRSTARAVLSLLPPGTEVTTISTLRFGAQSWAWAVPEAISARASNACAGFIRTCWHSRSGSANTRVAALPPASAFPFR